MVETNFFLLPVLYSNESFVSIGLIIKPAIRFIMDVGINIILK